MEKVCCVATSTGLKHGASSSHTRTFAPAPSGMTSEGRPDTQEEEEATLRQKKTKVKEKWKRKLINRLKTKHRIVQESRNWGMAKVMTKGKAWNAIVKDRRLKDLPNTVTTFDNKIMTRLVEFAISDSGATAHQHGGGREPKYNKIPDGSLIYSTHIGKVDIPWMPDSMTVAHIMPDVSHSSLISTKVCYDAGSKLCLMSGNAEYTTKESLC